MKKLILMLMLCAPMTMMAQKFGKVNTQQIMQSLPDVAKANGEMEALQKQKENDLKSMQDEFQRKADEYQKGSSTMNATANSGESCWTAPASTLPHRHWQYPNIQTLLPLLVPLDPLRQTHRTILHRYTRNDPIALLYPDS